MRILKPGKADSLDPFALKQWRAQWVFCLELYALGYIKLLYGQ